MLIIQRIPHATYFSTNIFPDNLRHHQCGKVLSLTRHIRSTNSYNKRRRGGAKVPTVVMENLSVQMAGFSQSLSSGGIRTIGIQEMAKAPR